MVALARSRPLSVGKFDIEGEVTKQRLIFGHETRQLALRGPSVDPPCVCGGHALLWYIQRNGLLHRERGFRVWPLSPVLGQRARRAFHAARLPGTMARALTGARGVGDSGHSVFALPFDTTYGMEFLLFTTANL